MKKFVLTLLSARAKVRLGEGLHFPHSQGRTRTTLVVFPPTGTLAFSRRLLAAAASLFLGLIAPTLARGAAGDLLVSNEIASTVEHFTSAGAGSLFTSSVQTPEGIAYDAADNVYVTSLEGTITRYANGGGTGTTFATGLSGPFGLVSSASGDLYSVNSAQGGGTPSIIRFTLAGTSTVFATAGLDSTAWGEAFDGAGNLFVTLRSGSIVEYTPGGVNSVFASGLMFPLGMAFDAAGNLYVADAGTNTIYRYTTAGVRSTFATGDGLNGPSGIAFDAAGDLFVANLDGGNVLRFTPGGEVSTFATGQSGLTFLAFDPGVVPEPSTWTLLGLGMVGTGVMALRRRQSLKPRPAR